MTDDLKMLPDSVPAPAAGCGCRCGEGGACPGREAEAGETVPSDLPTADPQKAKADLSTDLSAVVPPPGGTKTEAPSGAKAEPRPTRIVRVLPRGQFRLSVCLAGEHHLSVGDKVVISGPLGKGVAEVRELPATLPVPAGDHAKILRKAAPDDLARDAENKALEEKAFAYTSERVISSQLPMKLVRVDYSFDRSRAVFSFTSEKRVDFRELVRDLARQFHCRIEMRQIGIRDEARLLGGIGPCGLAYCCTSFLSEFAPISVKMAKDQNVILNPGKISGGCGRLLCCLGYEAKVYEEFARSLPKIGKKVDLADGKYKVKGWDIFAKTITLETPEGKFATMPVDEFREKMEKAK